MDVIVTTTKELSGVMAEYDNFDKDFVMYINSVFLVLKQLGVGPAEGFVVTLNGKETWEDFIPDNRILRESVKAYMGNKVRLQFDPPTSSALLEALTRNVNEFEWRLNAEAETT